MKSKLRAALSLSGHERWLLLQSWVLLLTLTLALRLFPFPWIQRWSAKRRETSPKNALAAIRQTWRLLRIAERYHLFSISCLQRTCVLQRLLGQQGITTQMHIGVQREKRGIQAHAWLEYQGRPIGQSPDLAQYVSLKKEAAQ